jgi:hypothetical protein
MYEIIYYVVKKSTQFFHKEVGTLCRQMTYKTNLHYSGCRNLTREMLKLKLK